LVWAQNNELIINGNSVSFDKVQDLVEAEGSVEVIYKGVKIHGQHVSYSKATQQLSAKGGFTLYAQGITLEGKTLEYKIKEQTGIASEVAIIHPHIFLKGREIKFEPGRFELRSAYFSTCDLGDYYVTAKEIVFFPQDGWLVAYWGYFWLMNVPVVPMPTYIYDLYAARRARRNLPPFPEVSSNDEDGWYVHERLAWHLRRELSGTYSLTYAQKKGFGLGLEALYILNDNNEGRARAYWNQTDLLYGGITHRLFFGGEIPAQDNFMFPFLKTQRTYQYELETTFSYREKINYQKVSFLPLVVISEKGGQLFGDLLQYNVSAEAGVVSEFANTRQSKYGGRLTLYKDFKDGYGTLTPNLYLDSMHYSTGEVWSKAIAGISLVKRLSPSFAFGLGYLHYLSNTGSSPFNYEMYKFRAVDRLTADLSYNWGVPAMKIHTSYFTDKWDPEDIDYTLYFIMHCYNLGVTYRSLRNEFQAVFEINGR